MAKTGMKLCLVDLSSDVSSVEASHSQEFYSVGSVGSNVPLPLVQASSGQECD